MMHRNAGAYRLDATRLSGVFPTPHERTTATEAWELYDRDTNRPLGSRQSPSLGMAARKRASLIQLAGTISEDCREDTERRTDIRRVSQ